MSFENYQNFPSQQGGQDAGPGPGGPPQQDTQMGGQMPDAGAQYPGGDPSSAGGHSQGGDEKTTLWYETPTTLFSAHLAQSHPTGVISMDLTPKHVDNDVVNCRS